VRPFVLAPVQLRQLDAPTVDNEQWAAAVPCAGKTGDVMQDELRYQCEQPIVCAFKLRCCTRLDCAAVFAFSACLGCIRLRCRTRRAPGKTRNRRLAVWLSPRRQFLRIGFGIL